MGKPRGLRSENRTDWRWLYDLVLELAIAAGAGYIITHNVRDFAGSDSKDNHALHRSLMSCAAVIAILAVPVVLAVVVGSVLLRKAFVRPEFLAEEFALAGAWVFVVGGLVWLGVFLRGSTLLGFGAPWTWITAAHFGAAGFGALTVTALSCRVVSKRPALRALRVLLVLHPIVYLVTAGGILGYPYCDEVASVSYVLIFAAQLAAVVRGGPHRMARGPRVLLLLALVVPLATLVPALAWAWGRPIFNMMEMARYHGIGNAIGHVGLGLAAFAWGRPRSHSPVPDAAR